MQPLIIDATAKGNLRKELINHFGLSTARAVLTRFGFVQGWRMAEAMQDLFEWESEEDCHHACGRIHMLGGMYRLGPGPPGSLTKEGLTLIRSFEAEQHIAHLGLCDEIEKDYIMAVLDLNGGNRTRTAKQLGIGSATLSRRLKSYGVVP